MTTTIEITGIKEIRMGKCMYKLRDNAQYGKFSIGRLTTEDMLKALHGYIS